MKELVATFEAALADPEAAQEQVRRELLSRNAGTAYGRAHGFAECADYAAFSARVPVVSYDDLAPYMDRVVGGEQGVLIADPVVYLATSSGTTGRKKYVPIHEGFGPETDRWMALERHFLERAHPEVRDGLELRYVNRVEGQVDSGLPCGAVSGWYYGAQERDGRYDEVVPYQVYQLAPVVGRNYGVLRFALGRPELRRMSAVNPSTLLLVAQRLAADAEALIRDVRDGGLRHPEIPEALSASLRPRLPPDPERARALEAAIARDGALTPGGAWPELNMLLCWVNAGAGLYRDDLGKTFGSVGVWDYGYTSSEGRVTVTADDEGAGVPLLTSVFLELRDEAGRLKPLYAAADDEAGELVVTNSRGLYRYTMGDVVQVSGRMGRAPLLRFRRKTTAVASLTGEKLTEEQVVKVVEGALAERKWRSRYFCLAPRWGTPPSYLLLLELDGAQASSDKIVGLAAAVEAGLHRVNAEYEKKRETLRLGPVAVKLLPPGAFDRYFQGLVAGGREAARIKIPRVTMDVEHEGRFEGEVIAAT